MNYRVTCTSGNGYYCGCCRYEHQGYKDFTNYDEAVDFIHEIIALGKSKDFMEFPEDSDIRFDNFEIVHEEIHVNIEQYKIDQKIEKFKAEFLERKAEKELETKQREKAEFERLKKKLGEN